MPAKKPVSAAKSANALLAVYIGGAGGFFGPILGTIVVVLLQSGVSLLSNAWLLYVGVLFIVMLDACDGAVPIRVPANLAGEVEALIHKATRKLPLYLVK
jgi:branched-chain amino acid transport system permease protein